MFSTLSSHFQSGKGCRITRNTQKRNFLIWSSPIISLRKNCFSSEESARWGISQLKCFPCCHYCCVCCCCFHLIRHSLAFSDRTPKKAVYVFYGLSPSHWLSFMLQTYHPLPQTKKMLFARADLMGNARGNALPCKYVIRPPTECLWFPWKKITH